MFMGGSRESSTVAEQMKTEDQRLGHRLLVENRSYCDRMESRQPPLHGAAREADLRSPLRGRNPPLLCRSGQVRESTSTLQRVARRKFGRALRTETCKPARHAACFPESGGPMQALQAKPLFPPRCSRQLLKVCGILHLYHESEMACDARQCASMRRNFQHEAFGYSVLTEEDVDETSLN